MTPAKRRPSAIERAFELAREGCTLTLIARLLKREGYISVASELDGYGVRAQLRKIVAEAVRKGIPKQTPRTTTG